KTAAKPRLKKPASQLGFSVVCGIVEQHMADAARLVDDEPPPPQQTAGDDVFVEGLGRIGRKRIIANKLKELTERQRSVGSNRQSKPRRLRMAHCAKL